MDRLSRRDSEDVLMDFHDVYGGPPRRGSMQEWRYSLGGGRGSNACCHGDPWKAQGEKPVFRGESQLSSRRRYNVSEDFFDDIFGGSESGCSTPRRHDSGQFSTSPRSRILSPVKLLPESLGSSCMPAQFSLPGKVSRPLDSPVLGSAMSKSKISSFRYQGTAEEMKMGTQSFYHPSPLSHVFSLGSEQLLSSIEPENIGSQKESTNNSRGMADISHFHFSIYRWASKGIPLALPLRRVNSARAREKAMPKSLYSDVPNARIPESASANEENISCSSTDNIAPVNALSGVECRMPKSSSIEESSSQHELEACQAVGEVNLPTDESEIQDAGVPNASREEILPDALPRMTLHEHLSQNKDLESEDPCKRNHDDKDERTARRHRKLRKSGHSLKQGITTNDKKKQVDRSNDLNGGEVIKGSVKGSGTNLGKDLGRYRVHGKVKEFIQIFNRDTVPKGKLEVCEQNESIREINLKEKKSIHCVNELDNALQAQSFRKAPDNCNVTSHRDEHDSTNNVFSDASSEQKSSSTSGREYTSDEIQATVVEVGQSFNGNFQIKELQQDAIKGRELNDVVEDIQAIDSKIRKWSSGKEGNIRSLLSTLQYVLWPNSGWKPVPLVDIIEGPAVKRVYQKALLCLHPDKLQQKGAALYQKHTAQQVYEILQFLSAGSLGPFQFIGHFLSYEAVNAQASLDTLQAVQLVLKSLRDCSF